MPIKTHTRPVKGWTIKDLTFPKGYFPRKVRWRIKDGIHQVRVDKILKNETQKKHAEMALEEVESVVPLGDGFHILGWKSMSEESYLFDVESAERV